jgi:hypothetical protein
MMSEFKVILNADGATILDQDAQAINSKDALSLLETLRTTYEKPASVYFLFYESKDLYKIGLTSQDLKSRLAQVRYDENARDISLIHAIRCDKTSQAIDLEFMLHSIFDDGRAYGEWFHILPEWIPIFKSITSFIDAVNRLVLIWRVVMEKRGYKEFPPKEETVHQRCLAQLEEWHNAKLEKDAKMEVLVKRYDELISEMREVKKQINELRASYVY